DASNPNPLDPNAPPIRNFHKTNYCEVADLDHSWNGSHTEYDNGAMDGFTKANVNPADPTGSRTMGRYDQTDLPFSYAMDTTCTQPPPAPPTWRTTSTRRRTSRSARTAPRRSSTPSCRAPTGRRRPCSTPTTSTAASSTTCRRPRR